MSIILLFHPVARRLSRRTTCTASPTASTCTPVFLLSLQLLHDIEFSFFLCHLTNRHDHKIPIARSSSKSTPIGWMQVTASSLAPQPRVSPSQRQPEPAGIQHEVGPFGNYGATVCENWVMVSPLFKIIRVHHVSASHSNFVLLRSLSSSNHSSIPNICLQKEAMKLTAPLALALASTILADGAPNSAGWGPQSYGPPPAYSSPAGVPEGQGQQGWSSSTPAAPVSIPSSPPPPLVYSPTSSSPIAPIVPPSSPAPPPPPVYTSPSSAPKPPVHPTTSKESTSSTPPAPVIETTTSTSTTSTAPEVPPIYPTTTEHSSVAPVYTPSVNVTTPTTPASSPAKYTGAAVPGAVVEWSLVALLGLAVI